MPNEVPARTWAEEFNDNVVLPVLTGTWITWETEPATKYREVVKSFVELASMLRQRCDEQLDNAQNIGKFAQIERMRKARNSEDGPKEDPLELLMKSFVTATKS